MTKRRYFQMSKYLLGRTRRKHIKMNARISVFTLEFQRSLESSLLARAQSFPEQRLGIKPIPFYVVSFSHTHLLLRALCKFSDEHIRLFHAVLPLFRFP